MWVKGFCILYFTDSFGDLGRDYYIDKDGIYEISGVAINLMIFL